MPYFASHSMRDVLCKNGKLPEIYCIKQFVFGAERGSTNYTSLLETEKIIAITYSSLIFVFYAAIVMIVLCSNLHRFKKKKEDKRRERQRPSKWEDSPDIHLISSFSLDQENVV